LSTHGCFMRKVFSNYVSTVQFEKSKFKERK
jgi:hypothetical protein